MDWINMSDRDKLYNYAKEFVPANFHIVKSNETADSYFIYCKDSGSIHDLAIMEYDVGNLVQFKNCLVDMWNNAGFKDPALLATIVAVTTLKNMPAGKKNDTLQDKPVEKESYESVSKQDAPPVFIYEF